MDGSNNESFCDHDVVIVGCGLAGLSAASKLLELNPACNIALVEARDRLGGRLETQHVNLGAEGIGSKSDSLLYPVDVGGQWIGPAHTEMIALLHGLGVKLIPQEYPRAESTTSDRHRPPSTDSNTRNNSYSTTDVSLSSSSRLVECAYYTFPPLSPAAQDDLRHFHTFLIDSVERMDPERPWQFPEAQRLDAISAEEVVRQRMSSEQAREEVCFYLQTILAVEPSKCSWLFFLFYVASGGGVEALGDGDQGAQKWKVEGGAGIIAQLMWEQISVSRMKQPPALYLNCEVQHIDQSGNIKDHVNEKNPRTEDDASDSMRACSSDNDDHDRTVTVMVVSTADCHGSLREIRLRCRRVIVTVPLAIITRDISFTPPMPQSKTTLATTICPGGVFKVIVCYPIGTCFGQGVCLPLKDLGLVHNVFASQVGDFPSLVGLITGSAAETFKRLDDQARRSAVLSQFAAMYALQQIEPLVCVIRNWTSDEKYSGGCFAGVFPPTTESSFVNEFPRLKTPWGRVHFAGTETSEHFYGYMEGARRSGLRAATDVYEEIKECLEQV